MAATTIESSALPTTMEAIPTALKTAKDYVQGKEFMSWDNPEGFYLIRGKVRTPNAEYRLPKMGKLSSDTSARKCFYKTIRQAKATQENFLTHDLDYFLLFIHEIMQNEESRLVGDDLECQLYSINCEMEVYNMGNDEALLPVRLEVRIITNSEDMITNASIKLMPVSAMNEDSKTAVTALKMKLAI